MAETASFSPVPYRRGWQALKFAMPLALLVVLWQVIVTVFDVNPRILPDVPTVALAGWSTIADGSLAAHVGLFSDLPEIPAEVAIDEGYVFQP